MLRTCIFLTTIITAIYGDMEKFVVGGEFVNIEQYAHSVYLSIKCRTHRMPMLSRCGGSILNQRIVVTAAHCLARCRDQTTIAINVGSTNRQHGAVISADGYVIHENYDPLENFADIALIRTSKPMKFGSRVNRVAIMKDPPDNETAVVAGWGMVDDDNGIYDDILKAVTQTVYPRSTCRDILEDRLPKGTLCATNSEKKGRAAGGDSGAGLIVRDYILLGLVSCKAPELPDITVYTDVAYYYEWIVFNVNRLYCYDI